MIKLPRRFPRLPYRPYDLDDSFEDDSIVTRLKSLRPYFSHNLDDSSEDDSIVTRLNSSMPSMKANEQIPHHPEGDAKGSSQGQPEIELDLPNVPKKASTTPARLAFREHGQRFPKEQVRWRKLVQYLEDEQLLERLQWSASIMQCQEGKRWDELEEKVKQGEKRKGELKKDLDETEQRLKALEGERTKLQKKEEELEQEQKKRQRNERRARRELQLQRDVMMEELELSKLNLGAYKEKELRELQDKARELKEEIGGAQIQQLELKLSQAKKQDHKRKEKTQDQEREEKQDQDQEEGERKRDQERGRKQDEEQEGKEEKQDQKRNGKQDEEQGEEEEKQDQERGGKQGKAQEEEGEEEEEEEGKQDQKRDGKQDEEQEEEGEEEKQDQERNEKQDEEQVQQRMQELQEIEKEIQERERKLIRQQDERIDKIRIRYLREEDKCERFIRSIRRVEKQIEEGLHFVQAELSDLEGKIYEENKQQKTRIREHEEVQNQTHWLEGVRIQVEEGVKCRVQDLAHEMRGLIKDQDQMEKQVREGELEKQLKKVREQELGKVRKNVREEGPNRDLVAKNFTVDEDLNNLLDIYCALPKRSIYEALPKNEIRLLVLLPAPNRYHPLIGVLKTVLLSDKPKFAALSYWWGPDSERAQIYLLPPEHSPIHDSNGGTSGYYARHAFPVSIRNNLFCALHRLRRTDKAVTLWVDSLCVNQESAPEKTEQLGVMVDIYHAAQHVCVWLGEADDNGRSNEAMDFIPSVVDMATLDKHTNEEKHTDHWAALTELMRDRWFSRRWVVQEISLAKSATVHCGEKSVYWTDFADAVSLFVANQERVRSLFDFSKWRYGPDTLGEIQSMSANVLLQATSNLFLRTEDGGILRPTKNLESLVTSLITFDATDPRDIIYSLVYIASDTSTPSTSYQKRKGENVSKLEVDYAKRGVEVYKDFTEFCVKSSNSLDIICRHWAKSISGGEDDKLPSWIPLLADAEFGGPGEEYRGRKNGQGLVGPVGRPCYKASGDTVASSVTFERVPNNSFALIAEGFKLATVVQVSPRHTAGLILQESLQMAGWTGIEKNTTVPDKVWRTLIVDRDSEGQIAPTWYQRACLRCLEIADTFNNGDLNIGQLLQQDSEMLRIYLRRVRRVTWNRKFFTATRKDTKEGESPKRDILGLCPRRTEKDDIVCILFGCSVPVILREHKLENAFELIGEAYVHGKMDGEAMADYEDDKTQGKMFFRLH